MSPQGPEGRREDFPAGSGSPVAEPVEPTGTLPRLGAVGTARFVWRQLTSMRVALFLLLLLAVGAVPGSVFPQTGVDPSAVATYREDHPGLSPWLERLGMFDVYSSPWFSAIYLLLFVSLVGCVLPRSRQHLLAWRARPPRTPARLERLPEHRALTVPVGAGPGGSALEAAAEVLRRKRYRVDLRSDDAAGAAGSGQGPSAASTGSVAAERGHLRETGNLVFHLALVGLLLALAASSLLSYRGQVVVPVGEGFSNSITQYDTFDPGPWVDTDDLPPFAVDLEDLAVEFEEGGAGRLGEPRDFDARVTVRDTPDSPARLAGIRVNEPLAADGAEVYLSGNGYAPLITVRDAQDRVVYSEATPFLAQDAAYTSTGTVKVFDSAPEQLGFTGLFLPTAVVDPERGPISVFPDARAPQLFLTGWSGDLGPVNDGQPVNVYELDTEEMTQLPGPDGQVWSAALLPGDTVELPEGRGSLTFEALPRFAALDVRHDPGRIPALVFSVLAMGGLVASLFVPRRRVFVRVTTPADGGAEVVVAGLARGEDARLGEEVDDVRRRLGERLGAAPDDGTAPPGPTPPGSTTQGPLDPTRGSPTVDDTAGRRTGAPATRS